MSEASLRDRWMRHAKKQGLKVRAMGPHQIPGMSDLYAADKGTSEMVASYGRTRGYWIEAKLAKDAPLAFSARRDATANQVKWLWEWAASGIRGYWLVLSPEGWLLVDCHETELKREVFRRKMRKYGNNVYPLIEDDRNRKERIEQVDAQIRQIGLDVAKLYAKK